MVDALNLITMDDLATEIMKQHHDSDLMRMLLADLRLRRVDLKEFCRRLTMLIGAPALVAIVTGLRVTRSVKKAQLQEREHQLVASPVGSGCRPLRAPAGGPTPPSTASTTAADVPPAAAPPVAASPAAAPPVAASPAAAPPAAAGGYVDHAEIHSLKRKVEVLQQANQRLDAENAVIKQKLAGKRVLLDSSAYATQRMLFKRMLLKRVLLERYDRA